MWDAGMREAEVRGGVVMATLAAMIVLIVIELSVVAALNLPLGGPDLVLVVLAFVALTQGPVFGAIIGFVTGLVADLLSTHVLGHTTMIFCLIGYGAGLARDEAHRTAYLPLAVVATASAMGTAAHAAVAGILGDARLTGPQTLVRAMGAALYALALAPIIYPLVLSGMRRLSGDDR